MLLNKIPYKYGGVAQLGEHLPCKQGVMGSIPIISTSPEGRVAKLRGSFGKSFHHHTMVRLKRISKQASIKMEKRLPNNLMGS